MTDDDQRTIDELRRQVNDLPNLGERVDQGRKSSVPAWKFVLREYKLLVYLLVAGATIVYGTDLGTAPDPPPILVEAAIAVVVLGPPGYVGGMKVVDWVRRPDMVRIFECDAERDVYEPHRVPRETWEDRIDVEHAPYPVEASSTEYFVRKVDWDEENEQLYVYGDWRGTAPEPELIRVKSMIEDTHGYLQDEVQEYHRLDASLPSFALRMQRYILNAAAAAMEHGSGIDGDAVAKARQDALEDLRGETPERPRLDDHVDDSSALDDALDDAGDDVDVDERAAKYGGLSVEVNGGDRQ